MASLIYRREANYDMNSFNSESRGLFMRFKTYRTHWSYLGPGIKRRELMVDFVLDIVYLFGKDGTIPPLHVLNEVLEEGGNNGGMGPDTPPEPPGPFVPAFLETWQTFHPTGLHQPLLLQRQSSCKLSPLPPPANPPHAPLPPPHT